MEPVQYINKHLDKNKESKRLDYWNDNLYQDIYVDYFNRLSSRELDREFNKDMNTIIKAMKNLSENERKKFIDIFSRLIEFYLKTKIEKEIDDSIYKILKF